MYFDAYSSIHNYTPDDPVYELLKEYLTYGILHLLAAVATLASLVIVALSNFKVFKPLLDKTRGKMDERKKARKEKKISATQKKVESLQAQLDDLKDEE